VLHAGGVVALPTETYYGLAVDPFNKEAVSRLFALKRRPPDKPVLTLVESTGQLGLLAQTVPPQLSPLMERFWPGPLTIVFEAREEVPQVLTGYTGTIGVRISSHPVAARLVKEFGGPITATSANVSGQPAAVTAEEVIGQLGPDVDMVLDGGPTPGGAGSTIVALRENDLVIIRPGVIPAGDILAVAGRV